MDYLDCKICGLGCIDTATEVGSVRSNVREFHQQEFTVWRCGECHSLHCKEDIDFEQYYRHYPLTSQSTQYLTRVSYLNRIRILRRAGLQKHDRILDFGCGAGLFLNYLQSRGFREATGYDPYVETRNDVALLNEKYDQVYSFGVIEHVEDPRAFLEAQASLLNNRGKVVVATPNSDGLQVTKPDSLLMHQPYHRHILSLNALQRLAVECGLSTTRIERKNWLDTWHPGLNSRFVSDYIHETGGCVDSLFERKKIGTFLSSPSLWWSFWFGNLTRRNDYMIVTFEKAAVQKIAA